MARLKDVLKKLPKKRSLLRIERKDRELSKSKGEPLRKVLNVPGKGSIPKFKNKEAISESRKRRTRTVKKR